MNAADVCSIEADGVDTLMAGQENGALIVESLGDDCDAAQAENFFGANDGIDGAKTCVIANDVVGGNAGGDEMILHSSGFVVAGDMVVAAN